MNPLKVSYFTGDSLQFSHPPINSNVCVNPGRSCFSVYFRKVGREGERLCVSGWDRKRERKKMGTCMPGLVSQSFICFTQVYKLRIYPLSFFVIFSRLSCKVCPDCWQTTATGNRMITKLYCSQHLHVLVSSHTHTVFSTAVEHYKSRPSSEIKHWLVKFRHTWSLHRYTHP